MLGLPLEVEQMPTHQVNLDALIRREDFESVGESSGAQNRWLQY